MKLLQKYPNGVQLYELNHFEDERGSFTQVYNQQELETAGIPMLPIQDNVTYNKNPGTIRGLHLQKAPYAQGKLIYCISGAFYSISVDLRKNSPFYGKAHIQELNDQNSQLLYIPKGFAHGVATIKADTTYLIKVDQPHQLDSAYQVTLDVFFNKNEIDFDKLLPGISLIQSERDKNGYTDINLIDSGMIYKEEF